MVDLDRATKEGLETVKSYLYPVGFETGRSAKIWRLICLAAQIILGCTFIFSGIVKGIDPLGTAIKITEYGSTFGISLSEGVAVFMSVVINVLEALMGFSFIIGAMPRITAFSGLVFLSLMTLLTLYLVIYNPIHDCGCFGDAVKVSNTATFLKNLILLPLAILLWVKRSRWVRLLDEGWDVTVVVATVLLTVNFNLFAINHLPIIDFRPYKVGSDLRELTVSGGTQGEYEHIFVYAKDGRERFFTIEELGEVDDSWSYVRDETRVIREAEQPAGSDFILLREDGSNVMEQLATPDGRALLLITNDLKRIRRKQLDRLVEFQKRSGEEFYLVMSNTSEVWKDRHYQAYKEVFKEVLFLDKTTAKTVIRSNPGLVVIDSGKIVRKLSDKDLMKEIKKDRFMLNPYMKKSKKEEFSRMLTSFGPFILYAVILIGVALAHQYHRRQLRITSFN